MAAAAGNRTGAPCRRRASKARAPCTRGRGGAEVLFTERAVPAPPPITARAPSSSVRTPGRSSTKAGASAAAHGIDDEIGPPLLALEHVRTNDIVVASEACLADALRRPRPQTGGEADGGRPPLGAPPCAPQYACVAMGGTWKQEKFVEMMNARAQEMGLKYAP